MTASDKGQSHGEDFCTIFVLVYITEEHVGLLHYRQQGG